MKSEESQKNSMTNTEASDQTEENGQRTWKRKLKKQKGKVTEKNSTR